VPEITVLFWVIKILTTAMGESTSDYMVHRYDPFLAAAGAGLVLLMALVLQFRAGRYRPVRYWFCVVMVAVFGTMAADGLHLKLHFPYAVSSALFAVTLAVVFLVWWRLELDLSIHHVTTVRREVLYWCTVGATFALGTAVGDLTATTLHLGYLTSGIIFTGLILLPLVAWRPGGLNAVACFWTAYVITRPLGASWADYMGKPVRLGGLGWGDGPVAIGLTAAIVVLVGYLAVTHGDDPVVVAPDPA
jgi:uncharacterized membrane-anchored protein